MNYDVTLEKEDIVKAIEFAKEFWKADKSVKDFGSVDDRNSISDKLADAVSGKLGELAFAIFAKREFDVHIKLDFTITEGKLAIDNGQDVAMINGKMPNKKTDIKSSKKYAQWLLIEQHKINEHLIHADYYVSVSLDLPNDIEKNWKLFERFNTIKAHVDGYTQAQKFFDSLGNPWFKYERKERLYSIEYIENIVSRWKIHKLKPELNVMLCSEEHTYNKYAGNTRMGIPLKAAYNVGLPKKHLKSNKDDFRDLFNILIGGNLPCP